MLGLIIGIVVVVMIALGLYLLSNNKESTPNKPQNGPTVGLAITRTKFNECTAKYDKCTALAKTESERQNCAEYVLRDCMDSEQPARRERCGRDRYKCLKYSESQSEKDSCLYDYDWCMVSSVSIVN